MVELADTLVAESPAFQRIYMGSYPYNLVQSGDLEEYYKILTDFDFLSAKIQHPEFGVQTLIVDYDLVCDPLQHPLEREQEVSLNPEQVKTLKRLQGALRLSAHILAKDKIQLAGQLWGRMQGFDVPEI